MSSTSTVLDILTTISQLIFIPFHATKNLSISTLPNNHIYGNTLWPRKFLILALVFTLISALYVLVYGVTPLPFYQLFIFALYILVYDVTPLSFVSALYILVYDVTPLSFYFCSIYFSPWCHSSAFFINFLFLLYIL